MTGGYRWVNVGQGIWWMKNKVDEDKGTKEYD